MINKPDHKKPADWAERWTNFVRYWNLIRVENPVTDKDPYGKAANDVFFDLLNQPQSGEKVNLRHAITVLERNNVPARDAGFILFVLIVFGAVWGNAGILPNIVPREEPPLGGEGPGGVLQ